MKLRIGVVAASLFGAIAASPAASAMPIAPTPQVSDVAQVRWVCDPWGRCGWRPNYYYSYGYGPRYYAPRYYGPRYYGPRHYGYRRW